MTPNSFSPAWWLPHAHLQTIWPIFFRRSVGLPTRRERIELPDGDFIDLDWVVDNLPYSAPILLMLHGLEGSINSHYAKGMLKKLSQCGWRGVLMHFRGCSGENNRLSRGYHSGETNDFNYLLQLLRKRLPENCIAAIGFSLGGNVLLKWLGEVGTQDKLNAAIAICPPFELREAAMRIQMGFAKLYQWYFVRCLRYRLSQKFREVSMTLYLQHLKRINTIYDFDEKITAPLHGFSSADDYYAKSSSRQFLNKIKTPTLILHALDDPLMTENAIPKKDELSPCITLEVSRSGGHVGFIAGNYPWRPFYWLEERVADFLCDYLKKNL